MPIEPIPPGYHTVTPYLTVEGLSGLVEFVQQAFAAEIVDHTPDADGLIRHAEFRIGDSMVMAGEASERYPPRPGTLYLYVADADAVYRQALAAGADSLREPTLQPYGDKNGGVQDRWGNQWWIGTRVALKSE